MPLLGVGSYGCGIAIVHRLAVVQAIAAGIAFAAAGRSSSGFSSRTRGIY
jgi:hypothetical protein